MTPEAEEWQEARRAAEELRTRAQHLLDEADDTEPQWHGFVGGGTGRGMHRIDCACGWQSRLPLPLTENPYRSLADHIIQLTGQGDAHLRAMVESWDIDHPLAPTEKEDDAAEVTRTTTRRVTEPDFGGLRVEADSFSYSGRLIVVDHLIEAVAEGNSIWYHVTVSGFEAKKDGTLSVRRNERTWRTGEDIPAEIRKHLLGREALTTWSPSSGAPRERP